MLSSKNYLKILFGIIAIIVTTSLGYSINFSKNYPIPIIDHISFDAKIRFIREEVDIEKIDTIVVGSSLALNNVQGIVLEKNSKNIDHVLNFSVWSIDATHVEQMLELSSIFPNIERIIYSGQFTSFNHARQFKNFDTDFIKKYMSHTLNPIEEKKFILNACKDISFCVNRQKEWKKTYGSNRLFSFLDFDRTGSAPLHMYGKDILQKRWNKVDGAGQHPNAVKALRRIAAKAKKDGIKFYFVQQPYRKAMIDKHKHIQNIMKQFPQNMSKLLAEYGAVFFNLHEKLKLNDDYFADRSHLNDKGSKVGSEALAKLIDKVESKN